MDDSQLNNSESENTRLDTKLKLAMFLVGLLVLIVALFDPAIDAFYHQEGPLAFWATVLVIGLIVLAILATYYRGKTPKIHQPRRENQR